MDFTNGGARIDVTPPKRPHSSKNDDSRWFRAGVIAALIAVVVLIVAAILVVSTHNDNGEGKYVDSGKLQAVFLNTGQVYFGNIKALNNKYIVLTNIYYLQTNSSSSSSSTSSSASNVSLVKLGCELHQPYDQMVINSDEITFWENLQSTGQVAKAVAAFQQQNPQGQKCSDQSSSASNSSGNAAQGASNNSATTGTSGTGTSTTTKSGQ